MKRIKSFAACLLIMPVALGMNLRADPVLPGQVDFGAFSPPGGAAEFVEVNLPTSLISLAARFVEKEEPDVAKLINGIKAVRVNVVGLTDENRSQMTDRVKSVRTELTSKGWEKLATVMKEGQDVGVYLKMDGQSVIQGLAVVVIDGNKHAVFVNIVGDIKPEQLTTLGERLHIEPLKNLVPPEAKVEK